MGVIPSVTHLSLFLIAFVLITLSHFIVFNNITEQDINPTVDLT